jgi:hypothetical protein
LPALVGSGVAVPWIAIRLRGGAAASQESARHGVLSSTYPTRMSSIFGSERPYHVQNVAPFWNAFYMPIRILNGLDN